MALHRHRSCLKRTIRSLCQAVVNAEGFTSNMDFLSLYERVEFCGALRLLAAGTLSMVLLWSFVAARCGGGGGGGGVSYFDVFWISCLTV